MFAPLHGCLGSRQPQQHVQPGQHKRLPYLANSDFHKPKHIYSWKTLVNCEKHPEAIKECIRKNERIAITLYREDVSDAHALPLGTDATDVDKPTARDAERVSPLLPAA